MEALAVVERKVLGDGVPLALRHAVAVALGRTDDESEVKVEVQAAAGLFRLAVAVAHGEGEVGALLVASREALDEGVELTLRHGVAAALGRSEDNRDAVAHGAQMPSRLPWATSRPLRNSTPLCFR